MEVGIIKVKDQVKMTNKIISHLGSKDNIKVFKEQIIKDRKRSQSFEEQMLSYMAKNKRIINLYEHKFTELAVFQAKTNVFQANTNVFQENTNASLKNLET